MSEKMTLDRAMEVLLIVTNRAMRESETREAYACVAAHLAKPAQAVDVGAIREVAKELNMDFVASEKQLRRWADKLTRAIGNAQPKE